MFFMQRKTPGAVTIGSESLGELGYGYASAASTGMNEQTSVGMKFGTAQLTDITNSFTEFTVAGNGWQPFFTTLPWCSPARCSW